MVDLTFANIKLFYELLFTIVGYTGERIDYETLGFPTQLPHAIRCEAAQA